MILWASRETGLGLASEDSGWEREWDGDGVEVEEMETRWEVGLPSSPGQSSSWRLKDAREEGG